MGGEKRRGRLQGCAHMGRAIVCRTQQGAPGLGMQALFFQAKRPISFLRMKRAGNVLLNHYVEPVGQDAGTARSWGKV